MEQVDSSAGESGRDQVVTAVYRHNGETVKVEVVRNFYAFQSHVTASVLNADRKWTVIAAEPDSEWHPQRLPLGDVARKLRDRAEAILGPEPELTPARRQAAPPRRPTQGRAAEIE